MRTRAVRRSLLLVVIVVLVLHLAANLRMAPTRRVHREAVQRSPAAGPSTTEAAAATTASGPRDRDDGVGGVRHARARDVAFLVDTPGCRILDLAANSSEVAPYVMDYDMGGSCGDPPPLVRSTDNTLFVDTEALPAYGVPAGAQPRDHVRCCYTAMWRPQLEVAIPDWGPGSPMPPAGKRKGLMWDKVAYGNDIRYAERECFLVSLVVSERVACTGTGTTACRSWIPPSCCTSSSASTAP